MVYYKAESEAFLAEGTGNGICEYMKKAEERLKEEEVRVDMFLHVSTRKMVRGSLLQIAEQKLTMFVAGS